MDPRDELVERSVEQARQAERDVRRLAETEARLGMEEAKAALAPARPAMRSAALALAFGAGGVLLIVVPALGTLARRPAICVASGAVMIGSAAVLARKALASFPPDLRARWKRMLGDDLSRTVEIATRSG